jgi:hypothetical protein
MEYNFEWDSKMITNDEEVRILIGGADSLF